MPRMLFEIRQLLDLMRRVYTIISELLLLATPKSPTYNRLESAGRHMSKAVGEISIIRSQLEGLEDDDSTD